MGGTASLAACARAPSTPTPRAPAPGLPPSVSPAATTAPTVLPNLTAAPPAATSSTAVPTPAPSDLIKNVVVFIQENHTFDSLFAAFPGADGQDAGRRCPDALPADPPHQHVNALVQANATSASARCSYAEADAPNYWRLAREFTLCDQYFSEVRGPSHPNYLMLVAAQTSIVNTPRPDACPQFCLDFPTIADRLDERGLAWRDYGGIFTDIESLVGRPEITDRDASGYFADAAAGALPSVSWLNSAFLEGGKGLSGHPPTSLCAGEDYAVEVLNAAMHGRQWESTALFLVWDDWGGFYDHVEPPVVEQWTDGTPLRYGFRVPCIVVSPYARAGYVSHTLYSHVSLLRFVETLFALEPLNERDAQANDLLDCFDFTQPPHAPITLAPRDCV